MINKDKIYNRNPLMVLSYLSKINEMTYGMKISEEIGINQGSASIILKNLKQIGLVKSKNIGKTILYGVNKKNPIIKYFRIFENLLEISELIENIKPVSREIILFGSCANGEDTINSDIDLFIVADDDNKDMILRIIENYKLERKVSPVLVNTIELIEMEENDRVFLNEVYKGIKLWEGCEI